MDFATLAWMERGIDPEGPFLLLPSGVGLPVRIAADGIDWVFRGYHAGNLLDRPDLGD